MAIKYPQGQQPPQAAKQPAKSSLGSTAAKRGMTLEYELNLSNQYYLSIDRAVIHKKPTPIQLVKVDYPRRSAAVVREAYFRRPSTTDYNGIYQGHYIDFDAKETRNKSSFPLKNFHTHQIEHLRQCLRQGGICFAIIRFTSLGQNYLYPASKLIQAWDQQETGGRKSILLTTIQTDGFPINHGLRPRLDYLAAVDQLLETIKHKGVDYE